MRLLGSWSTIWGSAVALLLFALSPLPGIEGARYHPLRELISLYGGSFIIDSITGKFHVRLGEHRLVFTPENPVVVLDERAINLPLDVRQRGAELYIPAYFVEEYLPRPSSRAVKRPLPERRVRLVVLDPGHGGIDPGAVGRHGLKEKDVTLDIARRLKLLLEERLKVKVLLTRDQDRFVPLRERTRMANEAGADLFISIHTNAAPRNSRARGMETYFLSEARTDWARAVAARENASIRFELPDTSLARLDEVSLILHDLAQSEFLKESSRLAEAIQEACIPLVKIPDRGVQQAGFFVLHGAFMPAVLVEVAFISNREEERLLKGSSFRQRLAQGIYEGIKRFCREYEKGVAHR